MNVALLTALAEPNRLRVVELLDAAPRSVGEVAAELGLRQPQATKHLQTLERAGLVTMHPLGQRRIYSLRREPLVPLRDWLDALTATDRSAAVLADYEAAVQRETALAQRDAGWAVGRTLRFVRELPGTASEVWSSWTAASRVAEWWAPEHFTVAAAEVDPVQGGRLRIVLEEGDGARYDSAGRFTDVREPERLAFDLAPLLPDGRPLFSARYEVTLAERTRRTWLTLHIRITDARVEAAPAIAGIRFGWDQALDKLSRTLG